MAAKEGRHCSAGVRNPRQGQKHLQDHFSDRLAELNKLYLQMGQIPECIFPDPFSGTGIVREDISNEPCSEHDIGMFSNFFGADEETAVTMTKRWGITGTLHRVSLITHPMKVPEKVLGVAVRVGRAMQGLVETMAWKSFLVDMARQKQSLVLIGKPGVGKTTCLREIARILAEDRTLNVVVVDKTCEIAGDGDTPHSAIGRARWMPVGKPNMQHHIMREAVENQTPDVIIVDEISTPQEVEAARTIAQRGVQLIATVHGRTSTYVAGGYSTSSPISTESPAYSGCAQNGYNVAHATTTRTSPSVARLPVQATCTFHTNMKHFMKLELRRNMHWFTNITSSHSHAVLPQRS